MLHPEYQCLCGRGVCTVSYVLGEHGSHPALGRCHAVVTDDASWIRNKFILLLPLRR